MDRHASRLLGHELRGRREVQRRLLFIVPLVVGSILLLLLFLRPFIPIFILPTGAPNSRSPQHPIRSCIRQHLSFTTTGRVELRMMLPLLTLVRLREEEFRRTERVGGEVRVFGWEERLFVHGGREVVNWVCVGLLYASAEKRNGLVCGMLREGGNGE